MYGPRSHMIGLWWNFANSNATLQQGAHLNYIIIHNTFCKAMHLHLEFEF